MKYLLVLCVILNSVCFGNDLVDCPNHAVKRNMRCGRCTSVDDPHINTLDGVPYDHHVSGCFQYITDCDFLGPPPPIVPFEVCGCHYACGTAGCIGDVHITFFDLTTGLQSEFAEIDYLYLGNLAVDDSNNPIPTGTPISFDPSCPGYPATSAYFVYTHIGYTHSFDIISGPSTPFQFYAHVRYIPGYLEIYLDHRYFTHKTCGLCGYFTLNPSDDFTGSDGVIYLTPPGLVCCLFNLHSEQIINEQNMKK